MVLTPDVLTAEVLTPDVLTPVETLLAPDGRTSPRVLCPVVLYPEVLTPVVTPVETLLAPDGRTSPRVVLCPDVLTLVVVFPNLTFCWVPVTLVPVVAVLKELEVLVMTPAPDGDGLKTSFALLPRVFPILPCIFR